MYGFFLRLTTKRKKPNFSLSPLCLTRNPVSPLHLLKTRGRLLPRTVHGLALLFIIGLTDTRPNLRLVKRLILPEKLRPPSANAFSTQHPLRPWSLVSPRNPGITRLQSFPLPWNGCTRLPILPSLLRSTIMPLTLPPMNLRILLPKRILPAASAKWKRPLRSPLRLSLQVIRLPIIR